MKSKYIGLLIIILFVCSAIPAASAEERQVGAATDFLATKTPTEVFDLISNNSSITPEIPGYDYMTNVLGTKLSMIEYIHILDVIQNQSLQTQGADFYMAYISKPDEVFVNPYINDTPRNLINKIPYYKSFVDSWDTIIIKYGKMSYNERIDYLNTIGLDSDSVVNLYETSDINTVIYMLNQSSSSLDELNSVDFNKSANYWMGHTGEAESKGHQIESIMEKFNNKSVRAYNEVTYGYITPDSLDINDSIVNSSYDQFTQQITKLNDTHKNLENLHETLQTCLIALGFPAAFCLTVAIMLLAGGGAGVAIVFFIIVAVLTVGLIVVGALFGCVNTVDGVLVKNITLLTSYRDALPH
jgi:hypothetical protein